MMGLWLRFDKSRLNQVTFEEYLAYLRKHSIAEKEIPNNT